MISTFLLYREECTVHNGTLKTSYLITKVRNNFESSIEDVSQTLIKTHKVLPVYIFLITYY